MLKSDFFGRIERAGKLPTPPGVVVRLLEITRQPDTSVRQIADTISADPVLTAKILRFVNSPMAGIAREVTSLHQAVALLGVRGVKMMALSFSVLHSPGPQDCPRFDAHQFTLQSLACGIGAKLIATTLGSASAQEAFVTGLLSQIGRTVLATAVPEEYEEVLGKANIVPEDLPPLERAAFGEDYASIGAKLLRTWGIPESVCSAVGEFRKTGSEPRGEQVPQIIRLAEVAASVVCPSVREEIDSAQRYAQFAAGLFNWSEDRSLEVLNQIVEEVGETRSVLDIHKGFTRSIEELETEVRERISELSFALHLENQAMVREQEDLMRRATTDGLTGVGNRAAFDSRLEVELNRALRTGAPCALLLLDVDRFKSFNDTYGHQAGDKVLQAVARSLDENVRKVDYVARYGGEEFAVIAPSVTVQGVVTLAERLRQTIETLPVPISGRTTQVTVSVGAAVTSELTDCNVAAQLIRVADEQLYAAKHAGRNQVKVTTFTASAEAAQV